GHKSVDHVKISRDANLRNEDRIELVAGLLDDLDHVGVHVMRIKTVDADRNSRSEAAPGKVVKGLDDAFARLGLFRECDGVFKIEEDIVGFTLGCLLDHRRVGAGDSEFAAMQTRLAQAMKCMAHSKLSSTLF